ncbi:hypothetical protein FOZ60_005422, partial [Perkinsus olseni]
MVENSLADPAENLRPAVVEVCALLGVKDSTLLRFLPDAEIEQCDCGVVLAAGPKCVGHPGDAATTSSDFGAVSFASGNDHTADEVPTMSRMLQIVKSIKLSNERCYEGYQDDRLLQYGQQECAPGKWLVDFSGMPGKGVDYLRSTHSA